MDRFRVWQKLHRGWRLIINCETRLITLITIRVLVRARSRVLTRGNYTSVGTIWIYDYVGEKKGGEESRWESRPRSAIREDTVAFITKQCHDITKIHLNKTIEGNKLSRSIHWRKKNTKMILWKNTTGILFFTNIKFRKVINITLKYRNNWILFSSQSYIFFSFLAIILNFLRFFEFFDSNFC